MTADGNKEVLRNFYEWMCGGDPADIDKYMASDFSDHDEFINPQGDREGMRQTVSMFRDAFPDLDLRVDEMISEGDTVAARFTATGTQRGQFMDIPPSGKSFEITGLDLVRFRDGQLVEHWGLIDQVSLLRQLGAMPE